MTKLIISLLLSIPFCHIGFCQTEVHIKALAGSYNLRDLRNLQEDFLTEFESIGIQVKPTFSFPWSAQAEIGFRQYVFDGNRFGSSINYSYTKGRIAYQDYSGQLYIDQILRRVSIGMQFNSKQLDGFSLFAKGSFGFTFLDFVTEIQIENLENERDEISFNAWGGSLHPGVEWQKNINQFFITLDAGYEINLYQSETSLKDNDQAFLTNDNDDEVLLNWSGIRIGAGMGFTF